MIKLKSEITRNDIKVENIMSCQGLRLEIERMTFELFMDRKRFFFLIISNNITHEQ